MTAGQIIECSFPLGLLEAVGDHFADPFRGRGFRPTSDELLGFAISGERSFGTKSVPAGGARE